MSSAETIEPATLQQAQAVLRGLVAEIAALVEEPLEPEAFYRQFLPRVVQALAAEAGAIWTSGPEGQVRLACDHQLERSGLPEQEELFRRHAGWIGRQFKAAASRGIEPQAGHAGAQDAAANPSEHLLLLAPVRLLGQTVALLEIFQRPNPDRSAQQGYLRFTQQMAEQAAGFLKNHQLRQWQLHRQLWSQLEQFGQSVHRGLEKGRVAQTIANEAVRLIGADRVCVAVRRGRKLSIEAVSGQDTCEPRSAAIRTLRSLVDAVVAGGRPLWHAGPAQELPPQLAQALEEYLDETHVARLGIVPLVADPTPESSGEEDDQAARPQRPRPVGALIVEQFEDGAESPGFRERVDYVARHSATALANVAEHEQVFLLPLWRLLGKSRLLVTARMLPKTLTVTAALVIAAIAAATAPYDFDLHTKGTLQPVVRRDVFAAEDGTVEAVHALHGQAVAPGQLLVQLRNTDLAVAITDSTGQRTATYEQYAAIERALFDEGRKLSIEERNRLAGQRSELKQRLLSLDRQLELLKQKRTHLALHSPIDGEVTTWDVEQLLQERPVQRGQVLLTVADSAGPWQLELTLPEDRAGYLAQWQADHDEPMQVTFRLATDPSRDFVGTVEEVHLAAEVRGEEGNTVLVKVAVDKDVLPHLRPGADVTAKIHCGRRSVGYVWLHDVLAFIQSRILFKL